MDTVNSIKNNLLSNYRVDSFVFIEDLESLPSSTLYQKLKPLIQEAYDPDYRFVFFNFLPVDNKTLIHISKILKFFDISPYFVLVVTNQSNTETFFQSLDEPITVDFINNQIDRKQTGSANPLFNNDDHMCAYAWTGVHINSSGSAKVCCQYNDTIKDNNGDEYNIKTHDINEIFYSDYLVGIRNQFRNGITPKACNVCVNSETTGGESKRKLASYKLKNIYGDINWESESTFNWIGGHLGNLCNLKCRICNERFSSSIAAEKLKQIPISETKSHQVYKTLINNNWNKEDSQFWTFVKSMVPSIRNFEFLGGEPLLVDANIKFMQYLLDKGYSQDCIFEFITNGTKYHTVFDQANKFKEFFITISIDNIGKRFEFERSGSSWDEVDSNLGKFLSCQQKNPNVKVGISITVNIQNVLYLPEVITYLNNKKVNHYYLNLLYSPNWLSVDSLTPKAKQLVLDKLTNANMDKNDLNKLSFVIKQVQNARTSDGNLFCANMKNLDRLRNENFAETHKEIAEVMGYL